MELTVEDDPDPADVARLEARVAEETARVTGHGGERQLAIFVRIDGAVVAGIYGWTWGGCCELQHLWVDEDRRGEGLANDLLDAAEAEAERRGCSQVVLFTHAANAGAHGDRWLRRGYELVGRVDDYPLGDAALWFRKALTDPPDPHPPGRVAP
jgi:ribosomal protein S18 acetylase RimI-like enzyme